MALHKFHKKPAKGHVKHPLRPKTPKKLKSKKAR